MRHSHWIGLALIAGLSVGCTSTSLGSANYAGPDSVQPQKPVQLLGQLALPPGAIIRGDQSLIIGAGDNWVGRVVMDVGKDMDAAYRYFLESYPSQGWTVVSAVRGKTSLVVMTRQERTATVEMAEGGWGSSGTVTMTMAPRNAAVFAPTKKP